MSILPNSEERGQYILIVITGLMGAFFIFLLIRTIQKVMGG